MAKPTTASRRKAALKGARRKKTGRRSLSASSGRTPAKRKRTTIRKRSRRRSGLSEIITNLEAKAGFNIVLNGAAGGLAFYGLEELFPASMPSKTRLLWSAAVAFGVATIGKAPYVGAGIASVTAYKALVEMGLLNDDAYADPLEQLPMVLDAEGNPMMLNDHNQQTGGMYLDENGYYLNEEGAYYLDENGNYLQQSDYQVDYAPNFSGAWTGQ